MVFVVTNVLIAYATMSGNTCETAHLLARELTYLNVDAPLIDVSQWRITSTTVPDLTEFDALLIGTYTWDCGSTPDEIKDFVAELGYKPDNVFVFGTGDTQFGGDDFFCKAADKLARFYNSPIPPLKLEQSPRGEQERMVAEWALKVKEMIDC